MDYNFVKVQVSPRKWYIGKVVDKVNHYWCGGDHSFSNTEFIVKPISVTQNKVAIDSLWMSLTHYKKLEPYMLEMLIDDEVKKNFEITED